MAGTMELVASRTLAADTASVTFSSIPGTYTDLYLVISGRTDSTGGNGDDVKTTFNGSTSGYSNRRLYGSGIVTGSDSNFGGTAAMRLGAVCDNGSTANTFGAFEMHIPNYAGSTSKSVSVTGAQEDNEATAYVIASAGLWADTSPITSITLAPGTGLNWKSGSTFYLYGIQSASATPGKFVTATGGVETIVGGFKYHTFTSSGTFFVSEPGYAEVLVVAGGGGGAGWGGGGGAGGHILASTFATGGPTSVVVGAGGSGATAYGAASGAGNISSFGQLTAIGGGYAGWGGTQPGGNGGSGGGAAHAGGTGGSGTVGQGNAGGNSTSPGAGGGGGAGAAGGNGASSVSGNGGAGSSLATRFGTATGIGQLSGGLYYFAGGGGGSGSTQDGYTRGTGGVGGGGDGVNSGTGVSGTANTGGGGGGAGRLSNITGTGGNGGSGVVIIRYPVN